LASVSKFCVAGVPSVVNETHWAEDEIAVEKSAAAPQSKKSQNLVIRESLLFLVVGRRKYNSSRYCNSQISAALAAMQSRKNYFGGQIVKQRPSEELA